MFRMFVHYPYPKDAYDILALPHYSVLRAGEGLWRNRAIDAICQAAKDRAAYDGVDASAATWKALRSYLRETLPLDADCEQNGCWDETEALESCFETDNPGAEIDAIARNHGYDAVETWWAILPMLTPLWDARTLSAVRGYVFRTYR